ncbi:MAG: sugar phosphate isomerase/epimerase [Clostridia bacterium]|nr:sugar phosphate isomerase/epimerase [Clostridia bacterium]
MNTSIISSAYFRIDDYALGLKKVREHGYDGVDYQDFINPKTPTYEWSFDKIKTYYTQFKKVADNENVKVFQMHAIWPSKDTTKEDREYTINTLYTKAIDACAILNCKYLVCHPIFPFGKWEEIDKDECYKINLDFFNEVLKIAKSNGITLCIENLPFKTHLSKVETVKQFISEFNDDNFKACLDTGHANCQKLEIDKAVKILGSDLKALHIHDNMGDTDSHLFIGDGNINWDKFALALKEIGYSGAYNLETKVSDNDFIDREAKQIALSKKIRSLSEKYR